MSEWTPKNGDIFYWIGSTFTVNRDPYVEGYSRDQALVEAGNCFRTYDDAVEAVEKFKSISKDYRTIKQKPKLTVEVFDRGDCPEWARWAAVDPCGEAFYYESKPRIKDDIWVSKKATKVRHISGSYCGFYSSDYKHSLIERPEKVVLPDWVKQDAIGWHAKTGYFCITDISAKERRIYFRTIADSADGFFGYSTVIKECSEAHCIVDAVDLVGKKVWYPNGTTRLITACNPNTDRVALGELKEIPISTLTESKYYQLIGEIKYKYQHMEDGEWVD